ncbi:Alkane hydroxylase MAH1 [Sesamum alatum]|uniref:Alkane hydroxylase MAH1 n=1 Tax=Sesamum alatum TaxID=300844 RepID=A0AAE1XSD7_9LAMI|nr:Alkane hydroxylase MAH1 [Sesamum alatum]
MGYMEIFVAIILALLLFLAPQNRLFPWNWPLIKLMPTLYLKSHELYDKITQILIENNSTIVFKTSWFTKTDILVTSDPANVQHILNLRYSIYQRGSEFRKAFDFFGDAIFLKDIEEWKEEKKFTHAFYKENQFHKSYLKVIHQTLEKSLIPVLDHMSHQSQVLDMQILFNRYMLDTTCLLVTGSDPGSLRIGFPKSPLLDAMDDMAEVVFCRHILPERVWKLQRWLGIGKEKKTAKACNILNQTITDYVYEKQELAAKNQENGDDFDVLKFYLSKAAAKGSMKYTEKGFLAANVMTLLYAGRDTSAALLTWFFYLISRNPLAEKKILAEIRQNFPPQKHFLPNAEELSKLIYLHCALCESLRLFPTTPVVIREPIKEDVLPSGHKVDENTKIILCSYAMGRMPEIWGEDCKEFKPERWMLAGKGGIKHVGSNRFLGFGSGPWACPGKEFAFTRMKAVAATILHNFNVEVVQGQTVCPGVSAVLTVKHGLKAIVSSKWI